MIDYVNAVCKTTFQFRLVCCRAVLQPADQNSEMETAELMRSCAKGSVKRIGTASLISLRSAGRLSFTA